ncbi:putative UPD-GlcNAc transporter (Mnn2-2) [Aspergillus ibericus CBS 121593]|uniref:UPD-GlcNAc transporter (Mnn2-2) n=1 Tax=Aspergillus ibericus CBS 121593 TaxID=1448316 RepID=A0A395H2P7_9EURO|nr:UPD-GlcNAc transporter (Mnn2-2) [Aspergillus ibericus CBS 121593]RAL01485.1 UPD-GlcNAc transporter (Mnn2-2) [Aspergillus ibericus CBS 121593]
MHVPKETIHGPSSILTQRKECSAANFKLETSSTSVDETRNALSRKTPNLVASNGEDIGSTKAAYGQLASIISAATHTALPRWTNIVLVFTLIFGGCCANVFALEAIIKDQPSSGPLITFAQFLLTSLLTAPVFLSLSAGPQSLYLSPRAIPLRSWLVYTAFFVTVNLLNNWAFAYKISVPLHIILRSGGPVASMGISFLFNAKRYPRGQVFAVLMLTLGVVTAALADAKAKGQSMSMENASAATTLVGFTVLALAMILSAFQGIYADRLYEMYGRDHWKEALFYSHTLSLPLFLPAYTLLVSQWQMLFSAPPLTSRLQTSISSETGLLGHASAGFESIDVSEESCGARSLTPIFGGLSGLVPNLMDISPLRSIATFIPIRATYLLINAMTQYLCIRGVHLLSAKSSSLTVTVILNIRKLVSLLLSIYMFGNTLSPGVLIGALFVFIGGALYGFEGARPRMKSAKRV